MAEHQRTRILVRPSPLRHWTQIASAVVRLSAVYLAILTVLFAAFRWPLFLAPGLVIAGALAWYSVQLTGSHL